MMNQYGRNRLKVVLIRSTLTYVYLEKVASRLIVLWSIPHESQVVITWTTGVGVSSYDWMISYTMCYPHA